MNVYKKIIRPLLFTLSGEMAHNMVRSVLRRPYLSCVLGGESMFIRDERLRVQVGELSLCNPVGLAAGLDKDCEMVDSLQRFGFGYIVCGSVLCQPKSGNPKPRIVRYPEKEAIGSCMGLPSQGLDYVTMRLRQRQPGRVPLIVNINGFDLREYVRLIEVLQPLVDGIEISLSCLNCSDAGGDFLNPQSAEVLFVEVAKRKEKPIFIKIPGYTSESDRQRRFDLIRAALRYPIDGFTISTGGIRVEDKRLSMGYGGVTGRPLFPKMLKILQDIYEVTEGKRIIKVRGGIFSAENAFEAIAVGATTVECYTGFVYEGWHLARNINHGLLNLLEKYGIENVTALRGSKSVGRGSTH